MLEMGSINNVNYLNEITILNEKNQQNDLSPVNETLISPNLNDELKRNSNIDINSNELCFKIDKRRSIQSTPSKCRKLMKRVFKSPQFHFTVVILVVLDCFCVSVELILDVLISNQNKKINEKASFVKYFTASSHKLNTDLINSYIDSLLESMNCSRKAVANINFNNVLLTNINQTQSLVNNSDQTDAELYALLHSIETVLKYVGN